MHAPGAIARFLERWVSFVCAHAWIIVVVAAMLTALGAAYTARHLGINTNTADMISPKLEWRKTYIAFQQAFPQDVDSVVIVVDGASKTQADRVAEALAQALARESALVHQVERPGQSEFFRSHALLYMDETQVDALADQLSVAQPFLGALSRSPTLPGLFDLVQKALTQPAAERFELAPLLDAMAETAEGTQAGNARALPWRGLLLDQDQSGAGRELILIQPILDFEQLFPAAALLERIDRAVAALGLAPDSGVRVRITGEPALAYEELSTVSRGAALTGLSALAMVMVVLALGLRSARLVLATLLTLLSGLILTATFAALAVGHLNIISMAFAVLYIGLGVDYAIHYGLRFQELRLRGAARGQALRISAGEVGESLFICAVTTGVGFYAFVPTDFAGVSELGLISGTGMIISLVANLTLLPALIAVFGPSLPSKRQASASARFDFSARTGRAVCLGGLLVALAAAATVPHAVFDDNPLNLLEPDGEAVSTARALIAEGDASPWALSIIESDQREALQLKARLEALDEVSAVVSIEDLVPADQEVKLETIADLELLLGVDLDVESPAPRSSSRDRLEATRALARALDQSAPNDEADAGEQRAKGRVRAALNALLGLPDDAREAKLAVLEQNLTAELPGELELLKTLLGAKPITVENMPRDVTQRWIAPNQARRLVVYPRDDLNDRDRLRQFVEAVQRVAPEATGEPVVQLGAGRAVVGAFQQAFVSALALIVVLLVILLRNPVDVCAVLLPLLVGGLLTVATMVALGVAFNFANVIALPLLLGIGADNGIHLVHRMRKVATERGLSPFATSTARAVVVSALTTLCGFGNLALSPHRGAASMGLLLTVGLTLSVIATFTLVPAMRAWSEGRITRAERGRLG